MKYVFVDKSGDPTLSLRSALLEATVRQHLTVSGVDIADASAEANPEGLKAMARVSSFPSKRQADTTVFVGLPSSTTDMSGRNVLLCTRPLADELKGFENRHAATQIKPPLWPIDILSAFDSVVFLERKDLLSSSGFAPWIKLRLVDFFCLAQADERTQKNGVMVFQHDKNLDGIDLRQVEQAFSDICPTHLINDQVNEQEFRNAVSRSSLHIHLGWSPRLTTVGLSPIDSLADGVFTIVLTSKSQSASGIGGRLFGFLEQRGYADITAEFDHLVTEGRRMLRTFDRYQHEQFHSNPEVSRFANENAHLIKEGLKRLENEVLL